MANRQLTQTVATVPESPGKRLAGHIFDAIGRKRHSFTADTDAEVRAALADVNFDTMPHGWFLIVRKAPKA